MMATKMIVSDPVFSIVLPLLLLAVGGIPLPGGAVWINHSALRDRKVESFVSLAGPLSNLVLGVALIWADRTFVPLNPFSVFGSTALSFALMYLALLQIVTFVINILPVPGLDGYGAIEPYLSPQARELGAKARPWAPLVLFALIFAVPQASQALWSGAFSLFNAGG